MPLLTAPLIFEAESVGLAMKNLPIGIEAPGVGPELQLVPFVFCCTDGTKTL
jgi:hypothetical protein